jgi:hypothetical protein
MEAEQVVARALQGRLTFLAGGEVDRLDGVDAEGLDDGLEGQGGLLGRVVRSSTRPHLTHEG